MIRGLEIHNAWKQTPPRPTYTYYPPPPREATKRDRFYITSGIQRKKLE